jgi:hypothetical protein
MYSPELERLIEMALVDGTINEKERMILINKAEALGVNRDEFEMVLDARIFELNKTQAPTEDKASTAPKKEVSQPDVVKCPACGAIVAGFAIKCADCGTEFQRSQASESLTQFVKSITELEQNRVLEQTNDAAGSRIGCGSLVKWSMFWWILIPLECINLIKQSTRPANWTSTDRQKEEFIMNFPVPITRTDITEFMALGLSKLHLLTWLTIFSQDSKYKNAWNKIWLKKMEQIFIKAELAMRSDRNAFEDIQLLHQKAKTIGKENDQKSTIALVAVAVLLVLFFVVAGLFN